MQTEDEFVIIDKIRYSSVFHLSALFTLCTAISANFFGTSTFFIIFCMSLDMNSKYSMG